MAIRAIPDFSQSGSRRFAVRTSEGPALGRAFCFADFGSATVTLSQAMTPPFLLARYVLGNHCSAMRGIDGQGDCLSI